MRSLRFPSNSLRSVFAVTLAACLATSSQASMQYTYDALGRLISVQYSDGKQIRYTYDAAGNRTAHIVSPTTSNAPPVAVADNVTLLESQGSITFNPKLNDTDPDGNPLTLFSVTGGQLGSPELSNSNTNVTYTSASKRTGADLLTYVIHDGQGMEASGQITISLANLSPVTASDTISTPRNTPKTFDPRANDTDPGGDSFTITSVSTPAHGTVTNLAGTSVYYYPTANYYGPDSFTYTVTDIDGGSSSGVVNVNVTYGSSPPIANADTESTVLNTAKTFNPRVNDSDPDGSALTIVSKTNGTKGTVAINSGTTLTYTPNTGQTGADSFTYTIADVDGLTATATVSMNIQASNSPPVAVSDSVELYGTYTNPSNGTQPTGTIDPRWNDTDPDGNPLTITGVTQPSNGTATVIAGGTAISIWRNAPCPGFNPQVGSVTYTISDGQGGTATGTITSVIMCESGN